MLKKSIVAASIASAVLLSAAPARASDWAGFYAGVGLAAAAGSAQSGDSFVRELAGGQLFLYGGYMFDLGLGVLGVEAEATPLGLHLEEGSGAFEGTWSLDYQASLKARFGLPIGPVMPYVTGGLAYGQGRVELENPPSTTSLPLLGYTVGAGVEALVSSNLSVRAEVVFNDFGNASFEASASDYEMALKTGQVRAGVALGF